MRRPIPPDPQWGSLEDVTSWYRVERDARLKSRLNAMRLLMEGMAEPDVALAVDVCVATVRNWRAR